MKTYKQHLLELREKVKLNLEAFCQVEKDMHTGFADILMFDPKILNKRKYSYQRWQLAQSELNDMVAFCLRNNIDINDSMHS